MEEIVKVDKSEVNPRIGSYATHVFHYQHVAKALDAVFNEVRLVKRFEFTPRQLYVAKKLKMPGVVLQLMNRRLMSETQGNTSWYTLGLSQFVPAILVRLRLPTPFRVLRLMSSESAFWVARASRGSDLLHFTDALGYRAIKENSAKRFVVEKRSPHHSVYDELPLPVGDFPVARRIRRVHDDIYDVENAGSHAMIVYSSVVKQSYVRQGYNADRIHVVPLPVGRQLEPVLRKRNPNQFCFVGRGDVLKGLDVAVEAVRYVDPEARLQVAGPMSKQVLSWLRSKPWVDYLGILDREQLREIYSTSVSLILPSTESFSLVAVEASYHGLHVVCSDQTGAAEYLSTQAVSVVEGRSIDSWADVLRTVRSEVLNGSTNMVATLSPRLNEDYVLKSLGDVYRKIMKSDVTPGLLLKDHK